jgi:hypothetical protein
VCDAPDPNDLDGDGVANAADNCPALPNMDQADDDSDDVGDLCDGCPGDTNPACFTVGVLRDPSRVGHPAPGTHVEISGLVVTAVKNSTPKGRQLWVQDPAVSEFGGLVLYFGTASLPAGIAVGNTVDVAGTYEEFFELSEITSPTVSITGTTTPLTPMIVDPGMLATGGVRAEPLESMLVTVSNVMVTNPNPDGPTNDYDEFAVTGNLRVDDLIIDGCDPGSTATGCMGVAKTWGTLSGTYTITGVMTFSFSNTKLTPRSKTDDFDPDAP